MQTFLPYPDFAKSASVLDRQRLGKQRVEVMQILRALLGHTHGWRNHPATRMWAGHETALADYGVTICVEWVNRGYRDKCAFKIAELASGLPDTGSPAWLGDDRLHSSHRANLIRKNADWYGQFGWTDDPSAPYWWPTNA
jgi:hypothetical protein